MDSINSPTPATLTSTVLVEGESSSTPPKTVESHSSITAVASTPATLKNGKQTFLEWLEEFLVAKLPHLLFHLGEWIVKSVEDFFKATGLVTPPLGPTLVAPEFESLFRYYQKFYREQQEGTSPEVGNVAIGWGKELTSSFPDLCKRLDQEKAKIASKGLAKSIRLPPEELCQQALETLLKKERERFLSWLKDMLGTDLARLPPAYRDTSAANAYWRIIDQLPQSVLNQIFDTVRAENEKPLTRNDDPRGPILAALTTLGVKQTS